MSDRNIETILQGLDREQTAALLLAGLEAIGGKVENLQKARAEDKTRQDEENEIRALQASGLRGANYTEAKDQIRRKYSTLRNEPEPEPTNPQIEKYRGRPDMLQALYKERLARIPRGNIREIAELKAKFRKEGLPL